MFEIVYLYFASENQNKLIQFFNFKISLNLFKISIPWKLFIDYKNIVWIFFIIRKINLLIYQYSVILCICHK